MPNKKQGSGAVLIYLLVLLVFVTINIISNFDIISIIYLVTLVCGILKYLMLSRE